MVYFTFFRNRGGQYKRIAYWSMRILTILARPLLVLVQQLVLAQHLAAQFPGDYCIIFFYYKNLIKICYKTNKPELH